MIARLTSRVSSKLLSDVAWWAVILAGFVLRLRQYLADLSLWIDEANLARNIVDRSFFGLARPLDFEQGAPLGFLFVEKTVLLILGNQDYILRLFPLFSGLLSLYLLYCISREYFGMAGLFSLFFFSISWPLIYYSSELKQYSSDVLVSVGLIYLMFRAEHPSARRTEILTLGAAGVISMWMSHPAIFILASAGLVLAVENLLRKNYSLLFWILGVGILWMANLGLVYLVSIQGLMSNSYLLNFWRADFMPLPPWGHLAWFQASYWNLLGITTYLSNPAVGYSAFSMSILLFIGMIGSFIHHRGLTWMMVLPFLFVLLASALQKYPFGERLILFLLPFLFLLMAEGLGQMYLAIARWNRTVSLVICGFVALVAIRRPASFSFQYFLSPYMREDIKPALAYVSQNARPGDVIYVYYGSQPAFEYYAHFYNFENDKVIFGIASRTDPSRYVDDIGQLRGSRRVWLVFSHVCNSCAKVRELDFYRQHLDQLGAQKGEFSFPGVRLLFYDLSP
jgi:hypothetical protein